MSDHSEAFRRYAADSSLVLGGLAAILLQLAHPVVARGVAQSSSFARDPLSRLRRTLAYVYAVHLGSPQQRVIAVQHVDSAHARVAGARDAGPQLWVTATLAHTGVQVHELLYGPLAADLAAETHAASGELGMSLQLPANAWPADRAAFDRYWDATLPTLEVGDDARAVAAELLAARAAPWWLRLALPAAREFTAVLLPPRLRDAYGLPDHPRRGRAVVQVARVLARVMPRRLRELPSRRLLDTLTDGAAGR
ncbi:oxygenase MpaB family protein [Paeniglutamicibacter sp.]|uniref:oxygenase MpaB family protein n=1 Tax=Paeniglutamicibacter sp. TaxID=1934391 RepID=UPI00398A3723